MTEKERNIFSVNVEVVLADLEFMRGVRSGCFLDLFFWLNKVDVKTGC